MKKLPNIKRTWNIQPNIPFASNKKKSSNSSMFQTGTQSTLILYKKFSKRSLSNLLGSTKSSSMETSLEMSTENKSKNNNYSCFESKVNATSLPANNFRIVKDIFLSKLKKKERFLKENLNTTSHLNFCIAANPVPVSVLSSRNKKIIARVISHVKNMGQKLIEIGGQNDKIYIKIEPLLKYNLNKKIYFIVFETVHDVELLKRTFSTQKDLLSKLVYVQESDLVTFNDLRFNCKIFNTRSHKKPNFNPRSSSVDLSRKGLEKEMDFYLQNFSIAERHRTKREIFKVAPTKVKLEKSL